MTHADGTQDEELYGAMRSAIGAEPPMAAQPYDDLARGRRRLLHRRVGTALAAVAVVPAVALVATVGPDGTSTNGEEPGFADASTDGVSLEPDCGWFSYGVGPAEKAFPVPTEPPAPPPQEKGKTTTLEPIKPPTGPELQPSDGSGGLVAAGDGDASCEAVPGEPVDTAELDRLETALTETLDPSGEHLSMMMTSAAGAPVSPDDPGSSAGEESLSQGSVIAAWIDGAREGAVDLSVIDPSVDDGISVEEGAAPCENPMLVGGPRLTCDRRQLDNGSSVLVGTGSKDGVERITVRFDRADGQVVWATADQGSSMWTDDGRTAEPLDAPPATAQQLIELVQDARVHL